MATCSSTYTNGCGLAQCCYSDTNANAAANNTVFAVRHAYPMSKPHPKGSLQCAISMRHIFGFVDDFKKLAYGMRDAFIRKGDNSVCIRYDAIEYRIDTQHR